MADCSTVNEGISCHQKGIEFIGTTLSGYTGPITPVEPDLAMVTQLSHAGCRVIAEGRYNTPALAANAIEHGARQLPLVPLSPVLSISVSGSVTQ